MIKSKSIAVIAIASVLLGGGIGTYGVVKKNETKVVFAESGYIIDGDEALEGGFAKYDFDAGEKMEYRYPDKVVFKDSTKTDVVVDDTSFLHYNDGSITALSPGVLIDMNDLESGMLNYYNLSTYATLENQGGSYALETQDSAMYFKNFLWKIGEKKYLLASDSITITMADQQTLSFEDYVELKYYNEGILLILSEEGAYRTVSSDCIATVENGMQVDLASRTVLAQENVLMSMEQVVIGSNDNIDVLSPIKAVKGEDKVKEEQIKIHIPTFEVINGKDGIEGEAGSDGIAGLEGVSGIDGIAGIDGEAGLDGEEGVTGLSGLNGTHGVAGADGLEGEDGVDGSQGTPGLPGTPGAAGASGANGAAGGAGAAGLAGAAGAAGAQGIQGNDGLDGDVVIENTGQEKENLKLPTFRWDNMEISSGSAKFTISYDLGNVGLVGTNDIIIKVYDNATGMEVRRQTLSSIDELNAFTVVADELAAEKEYRIIVNACYVVNNSSYEKTFLTKVFNTSELGITLSKHYVTEKSLGLLVTKNTEFSTIDFVKVVLEDSLRNTTEMEANLSDGSDIVDFTGLKSNTLYQVYMEVFDGQNTMKNVGRMQCRTLKKAPTLGIPEVVVNKMDGVFNMHLSDVDDIDDGIQYYRYELFECTDKGEIIRNIVQDGPDKSMLISNNDVLPWKVTEDMRERYYKVRVVASFYDNEKNVEYASEFSNMFSMFNKAFPVVTYEAKNEPTDENDTTYTRHDRLVGTLKINTMGTEIKVGDAQHPITISYRSGSGQTENLSISSIDEKNVFVAEDGSKTYSIPVDFNGLRANDNYVISVYAWTDLKDGTGEGSDADLAGYSYLQIGTVVAKTAAPAKFSVEVAKDSNSSVGFRFALRPENSNGSSAYEASSLDRLEFKLYNGDATDTNSTAYVVATASFEAKDILTADGEWKNSASQHESTLGALVYDEDSASGSASKTMLVSDTDFTNYSAGLIKGAYYTVEVSAVYDYTDYQNEFEITDITGGVKSTSNMFVLEKTKTAQVWNDELAKDGFTVIPILNNRESLDSVAELKGQPTVDNLPETAIIGFKVESKYDNADGLATEFTYHAYHTDDNMFDVSNSSQFYTDQHEAVATVVKEAVGAMTPYAVFMFKDFDPYDPNDPNDSNDSKKLTRGYDYYFTGTIKLSNGKQYPDDPTANFAPETQNVMRSDMVPAKFLAPSIRMMQYSVTGEKENGTMTYYYWAEADDKDAIVGGFKVSVTTYVDGEPVETSYYTEAQVKSDLKGTTQYMFKVEGLKDGDLVKVGYLERSYYRHGGSAKELTQQVYHSKFTLNENNNTFVYEVSQNDDKNRFLITVRPTDATDESLMKRLAAIKVKIKPAYEGSLIEEKELILPIDSVTKQTALVYLNYSDISEYLGTTFEGSVEALYDTDMAGLGEINANNAEYVAIQTVPKNKDLEGDYITLNEYHTGVSVPGSYTNYAKNSLFKVVPKTISSYYTELDYSSPLDEKFNNPAYMENGEKAKVLQFTAYAGGTRLQQLVQSQEVVTFKRIDSQPIEYVDELTGDKMGSFIRGFTQMTPIVDLYMGEEESYNIVTRPTGATVYWDIAGHEKLLADNGMEEGNYMYIALYKKGTGGVSETILDNRATSANTGESFERVELKADQKSYRFDIEGLEKNTIYEICFYYYDISGNKCYPLDAKDSSTYKRYSFSTVESITLELLTDSFEYDAKEYSDKTLKATIKPSMLTGFHVQYEIVRDLGEGNGYVTWLSSDALADKGIIRTQSLISETIDVNLIFNPGLLESNGEYFEFALEDLYLQITPVSPAGTGETAEPVGPPVYISLNVPEPSRPIFSIKALPKPGAYEIEFPITVFDDKKTIVDDTYAVVVSGVSAGGKVYKNGSEVADFSKPIICNTSVAPNIKVSGLAQDAIVTVSIYAVTDMNNDGFADSLTEWNPQNPAEEHKITSITASPMANDEYDLGIMSIGAAQGNKANLYFKDSVGLDTADCKIDHIIYNIAGMGDPTPHTYTTAFSPTLDKGKGMLYIPLEHPFAANKAYTILVSFFDVDGNNLISREFVYTP